MPNLTCNWLAPEIVQISPAGDAKASSKHLFAIKKIKDAKQWDKLPDVLKEIAILREEYPEDSLKELGEKTNPPIGKSGVNHRLSRLVELAETI